MLSRLRAAVRPTSVIQELCNAAGIVVLIAVAGTVAGVLTLGGVMFPSGVALGLWLAAGWLWLRGVGE